MKQMENICSGWEREGAAALRIQINSHLALKQVNLHLKDYQSHFEEFFDL